MDWRREEREWERRKRKGRGRGEWRGGGENKESHMPHKRSEHTSKSHNIQKT
jgi:hypothetical protein